MVPPWPAHPIVKSKNGVTLLETCEGFMPIEVFGHIPNNNWLEPNGFVKIWVLMKRNFVRLRASKGPQKTREIARSKTQLIKILHSPSKVAAINPVSSILIELVACLITYQRS
jgi:hypothetical protein